VNKPTSSPILASLNQDGDARRVLVVDDSVDSATTLAMLLRLSSCEVQIAHDGPGALTTAIQFIPDIILLDIGLPGMNGYELARTIRQTPALQGVRLIAITGYGQDEDRTRSTEAGFDHHLVKPVEYEALLALL
jgi:two-component system CheB/CheR fusion protein